MTPILVRPATEGDLPAWTHIYNHYGINTSHPASLALHERCGFKHVGALSSVGRKFDRYWDVAWLERPLLVR